MRWLGRLVLLILAIIAVILAAANDTNVVLRVTPEGAFLPTFPTLTLPLFVVVYIALFLGIVLGAVLEWMRGVSANRRGRRRSANSNAA